MTCNGFSLLLFGIEIAVFILSAIACVIAVVLWRGAAKRRDDAHEVAMTNLDTRVANFMAKVFEKVG